MQEPRPGHWPDISGPYYRYLLGVARRWLVGHEHEAEDVVDRAIERWRRVNPDHPSARLEMLIRSEALSLLRSDDRRRRREQRAAGARSIASTSDLTQESSLDLLRWELARTCQRDGIEMSATDIEVLELLLAGHTLAETARMMGVERHVVKRSRRRWQPVVEKTSLDQAAN